jgi:hypothetical protein
MYNFNTLMNLNDSLDFYDADHLNSNGVKIFCDTLVKLIDRKGYIDKAKQDNNHSTDKNSLNGHERWN